MTPEFKTYCDAELTLQRERYRTRAERFRAAATETHATWREGCNGARFDAWRERAVFMEGIKDIAALRLRVAYMPLFQTLQRIENKLAILASVRDDPYAPLPDDGSLIRTR